MSMTRQMRRASKSEGKRLQALEWNDFEDVTTEAIQRHQLFDQNSKFKPDRVWKNNKFVVQEFWDRNFIGHRCTKAMIRRCDSQPIYSWYDLQRLKNEIFGEETMAIQAFPPQGDLVDDANIYWLWALK